MTLFLVIVVVLAAIGIAFLSVYNRVVRLGSAGDRAWAEIETQLERRHGLIPDLVETVKGFATHERQTFERVLEAREGALRSSTPSDKSQAENLVQSTLISLLALAEKYPELSANERFLSLRNEIFDLEDQIQLSRRNYNAVVRELNNLLDSTPLSLIAGFMGFRKREYFELEARQ